MIVNEVIGFVMSISPISSSMMSIYVPTSGTYNNASVDSEHQRIIQELALLGIPSSGDKEIDKAKLKIAENVNQINESQKTNQRDSIPFDDIMNTLNLTITGNLEKDYETTIDRLDHEIAMAYTKEEKEYYEALKYQVEDDYNFAKQNDISYYSAASQISSLNRYMLGI